VVRATNHTSVAEVPATPLHPLGSSAVNTRANAAPSQRTTGRSGKHR
jgi:hypothetical protein